MPHRACRWSWPTNSKPTGSASTIEQAHRRREVRLAEHRRLVFHPRFLRRHARGRRHRRARCSSRRRRPSGACPRASARRKNHEVVHTPSGRKLGLRRTGRGGARSSRFRRAATLQLQDARPSSATSARTCRTTDLDDIVTGKARLGIDAQMPGMVYASDRAAAGAGRQDAQRGRRGARARWRACSHVVELTAGKPPYDFQALGGVAVIADNTWAAMQGRKKLKVEWDRRSRTPPMTPQASRRSCWTPSAKPGKVVRNDRRRGRGSSRREARCTRPPTTRRMLAHASDGAAGRGRRIQGRQGRQPGRQRRIRRPCRTRSRRCWGIKPEDVTCHVTLLGGGFGRKSKPDYVAEAALLSKQVGKPVKVVWSREDDIQFDFYHAAAGMYLKAAVDDKGLPVGVAAAQRRSRRSACYGDDNEEYGGGRDGHGLDAICRYRLPNIARRTVRPRRTCASAGCARSRNIYHAFAVQSFTDELAARAKRDRVEYLLDLLGAPRMIDFSNGRHAGRRQALRSEVPRSTRRACAT